MDTLSIHLVEDANYLRSREEEEEDDNEDKYDSQTGQGWAPSFDRKKNKQVYCYVGQDIVIEGALDSNAEALDLSHYLDTHREQVNLVDKAVLVMGAGSGLVSVVAALLGAWVTAADLPEGLNNLRVNLNRNTRGRCRHTPQVAALSRDHNAKSTYPKSVRQYDYVLAADVTHHHNRSDQLLATMKHFCGPGTTLIWANKERLKTHLALTENFQQAFHTSLLAADGDMRIVMATCKEEGETGKVKEGKAILEPLRGEAGGENHNRDELHGAKKQKENESERTDEPRELEAARGRGEEEKTQHECDEEKTMALIEEDDKEDEKKKAKSGNSKGSTSAGDGTGEQTVSWKDRAPAFVPSIMGSLGKDVYHYAAEDIVIYESMDSYGAVMWPAALALCSFLDDNRERVSLQGKQVLELGAGTGLVTIVASLLGASVTATDLPEVLGNLRANVMRNTRGRCRHLPQVATLSWGFDLERTHPASVYRYDYVLAADVVYHHDFLDELLATMKHFCGPHTTLIWANKVRMVTDLTFTENFRKAFHTSLLAEDEGEDMKIFMATRRGRQTEEARFNS